MKELKLRVGSMDYAIILELDKVLISTYEEPRIPVGELSGLTGLSDEERVRLAFERLDTLINEPVRRREAIEGWDLKRAVERNFPHAPYVHRDDLSYEDRIRRDTIDAYHEMGH